MAATVSSLDSSSRPGGLDACRGDVAGRGDADLGREAPQQVAFAEGDLPGEDARGGDRPAGSDSISSWARRTGASRARRLPHGCGELALVAGSAQEHHEPAGDLLGDLDAEVVLDEGQGDVDPGGHAGRRPDVAVARPDRIGVDVDLRVAGGEAVGAGPVGGHAAAVEQADGGEHVGPAADADDATGTGGQRADGADQRSVVAGGAHAGAAGDDQRVDVVHLGQRDGHDPQAALAGDRAALDGRHDDLVGRRAVPQGPHRPGGPGEHLVGSGDVERLHARIGDDHDVGRGTARVWASGQVASMTGTPHITPSASPQSGQDPLRLGLSAHRAPEVRSDLLVSLRSHLGTFPPRGRAHRCDPGPA